MTLRDLMTNPYMEGIYQSFVGEASDQDFTDDLRATVAQVLGTSAFDIVAAECGVGLSLTLAVNDGSRVQAKVLRGVEALPHQTECCRAQRYLVGQGFPCTVPIGEPRAFRLCSLQLEEFARPGEYRDAHDPGVRRLQAEALGRLHGLLEGYRPSRPSDLAAKAIPRDRVWNEPPQAVFRFSRHTSGDEAIRSQAEAAKRRFEAPREAREILSHEDWSNKHFRFEGPGIAIVYDWDSLTRIDELYTLGVACSTFTATWYYPTRVFPSPDEARAFVDEYAGFVGRRLTADERQIVSAYAAYTLSYIARCAFALKDGTLAGDPIEPVFAGLRDGLYF